MNQEKPFIKPECMLGRVIDQIMEMRTQAENDGVLIRDYEKIITELRKDVLAKAELMEEKDLIIKENQQRIRDLYSDLFKLKGLLLESLKERIMKVIEAEDDLLN